MILRALTLAVVAASFPLASVAADNDARTVIEKLDDLPRHSYNIELPVTELYAPQNRDALLALAHAVADDVRADLERYDIRDDNTVQDFYALLGTVALLDED